MITAIIAFKSAQAAQVENLLDWMYQLHGKKKAAACVLIAAKDCHEEFRTKVRLAAEVAFTHVDSILADPANLFGAALEFSDGLRSAWVYLEPDCVPLVHNWMTQLELAHEAQPKKILGPFMKTPEKTFVVYQSVYAPDINRMAGHDLTKFATKTRLIQIGKYKGRADARDKSVDDPAVLFCGDVGGELLKAIRSERK
jgi:hypothetical protein